MSDRRTVDEAIMAQTAANIDLAGNLLQEILTNPDALDNIPDGATLVLLPYDNAALALHNLAVGGGLVNRGTTVFLRRVGGPTDADDPGSWESLGGRLPRWSKSPGEHGLSLAQDPEEATLTVTFFADQRPTSRLLIAERTALLVDRETSELAGYVLPMSLVEQLVGRFGDSRERPTETARRATGRTAGDDSAPVVGYEASTTDAYAVFAEDLAGVAA